MQAVNDSQQFWSIARTSNHYFIKQIKTLRSHQRIFLSRVSFDDFMNESEIDDEQLIVVSKSYSNVVKSSIRLYVHSCFAVSGFAKLCEVYRTPLFSCYSQLLLLNTVCYDYSADLDLLGYQWYWHTIGSERILNDHEKFLFRGEKIERENTKH